MTNLLCNLLVLVSTNWVTTHRIAPVGEAGTNVVMLRQEATVIRETIIVCEWEKKEQQFTLKAEILPIKLPPREIPEPVFPREWRLTPPLPPSILRDLSPPPR